MMNSNQCPECGQKLQEETLVKDFYNPANYNGHGQSTAQFLVCYNSECDYQEEVEYEGNEDFYIDCYEAA